MQADMNNQVKRDILIMDPNPCFVARVWENSRRYFPLMSVSQAETLKYGLQMLLISAYDIVCLNTSQEGSEHMLDLLFTLRSAKSTRLVFYPIKSTNSRAYLLSKGADVCMVTNYPTDYGAENELSSILCALLRRFTDGHTTPGIIAYRDLCVNPATREVTMKGAKVHLTALEFEILYLLASNPGIVFSKEHIYQLVWREPTFYGCKSVSDHISSLRKKLGIHVGDTHYIETLINAGYRFRT